MLSPVGRHRQQGQHHPNPQFRGSASGWLEVLDRIQFSERPHTLCDEVMQLLDAPNCPSGTMDLVLSPIK